MMGIFDRAARARSWDERLEMQRNGASEAEIQRQSELTVDEVQAERAEQDQRRRRGRR